MNLCTTGLPRPYIFAAILSVLFFAPIPVLIFTGLEHVLQSLVTLLFVFYENQLLAGHVANSRLSGATLVLLGPLASTARYEEGLFAVGIVTVLLCFPAANAACPLGLVLVGPAVICNWIGFSAAWLVLAAEFRQCSRATCHSLLGAELASFAAHAAADFTFSGLRVARLMAVSLAV